MVLRCTRRLLKMLDVAPGALAEVPPSDGDWYANVLLVDRRKCVLVVHSSTLFSVFAPAVTKAAVKPFGPFVVRAIEAAVVEERLDVDTFGELEAGQVEFARTASRSALGCMNELGHQARWIIAGEGGLAWCDLAKLNHFLRRDILSPRGYKRPVDLARSWSGTPARQHLSVVRAP
jgi:hypothetical protein